MVNYCVSKLKKTHDATIIIILSNSHSKLHTRPGFAWLLGFLRNDLGIFHATMIKRFKLGYEWSQYMKEVRLGFLRALSAAAVVALWSQCTQIGEIVEQKRKAFVFYYDWFFIVWSPAFLTIWWYHKIIRTKGP